PVVSTASRQRLSSFDSDGPFLVERPPISRLFPYSTLFRSRTPAGRPGCPLRPLRGERLRAPGRGTGAPDRAPDPGAADQQPREPDRKSTRLNSSHVKISYAVFCLKKKKTAYIPRSL